MKYLLIVPVLFCCGCLCPEKLEMAAVTQNWKVIGPEYKAYVEADGALTPEKKSLRLEAVTELDKVIAGYNARKQ